MSQEKWEAHRKKYEEPVKKWEKLKKQGCSDQIASEFSGISRAIYFRYKAALSKLEKGIFPPSKRPKMLRKPQWDAAELRLVLKLCRENPTYGKAKISVILKRDHNLTFSESTVGRIIKHLMEKGFIQTSPSARRQKGKRRFNGHAQRWHYGMKATQLGGLLQIDRMSVSKNQIPAKHFQA